MTGDLAINLLAALIAFVVGWVSRVLYKYVRDVRPAARLWRTGDSSDFSIVVADGPPSATSPDRPTIHPAEFAAATQLSGYLAKSLRINVTQVRVAKSFPVSEGIESNLIVIGGPIHNRVHRLMLERLALPYEFRGRSLVRLEDGVAFEPVSSADGLAKIDYGFIVITANPFNSNARLVLLAGCRTFGCLGATRAIIEPTVNRIAPLVRAGRSYCVVVKMDVIDDYVGRVEVIEQMSFSATERVG